MKLTKLGRAVNGVSGGIAVFSAIGIVGTMDYQTAIHSSEGVSGTSWVILGVSALVFAYTEWLKN